jgi:hypothetical protein
MTGEKNVTKLQRWMPALTVLAFLTLQTVAVVAIVVTALNDIKNHERRIAAMEEKQGDLDKTLAEGKASRLALTQQVKDLGEQVSRQHGETMKALETIGGKLDRHLEAPRTATGGPNVARTP